MNIVQEPYYKNHASSPNGKDDKSWCHSAERHDIPKDLIMAPISWS